MSVLSLLNHLLNFALPALALAMLLVLASHALWRQRAREGGWLRPMVLHFVVGCAVLSGGLVLLGRDGRMLTYAALVLACATSQWLWLRPWRA
ncbi:hypothetical protein SAMN05428957_1104 [Oryzisolibacter propanilivorax]|uniref:Uncharacterized protein n=1 Tax=Oryzisolibacter propanilivorax TaxID=1527607 RepID=A0A1G9UTN4_9BURK|nr:hypothetical protein [Oryzisolibacter propanilivorax]SDM63260.1 hypothetical protein SAMN05428957_1104 [Oryzisolibacter propanilivorax]